MPAPHQDVRTATLRWQGNKRLGQTRAAAAPPAIASPPSRATGGSTLSANLRYRRIYAIGGSNGAAGDVNAANAAYATLFSFDEHAWHPSPPLLQGTEDAAATLGPNGRVYVAGGFDNG